MAVLLGFALILAALVYVLWPLFLQPVSAALRCPVCGSRHEPDAASCPHCGSALEGAVPIQGAP